MKALKWFFKDRVSGGYLPLFAHGTFSAVTGEWVRRGKGMGFFSCIDNPGHVMSALHVTLGYGKPIRMPLVLCEVEVTNMRERRFPYYCTDPANEHLQRQNLTRHKNRPISNETVYESNYPSCESFRITRVIVEVFPTILANVDSQKVNQAVRSHHEQAE